MGKPAQRLTKLVTDYLSAAGAVWWRNSAGGMRRFDALGQARFVRFGQPGVSDLCALYHGKFLAIEIKAGRDRLSEAQTAFLRKVEKAGGIAVVARDVQDVVNTVEILRRRMDFLG